MADILVVSVHDVGGDVLHVRGVRDTELLEARGWLSATRQHFESSAYQQDGQLRPDAQPRTMSEAEILDYARRLLEEQNPTPAPRDLGVSDPGAHEAHAAAVAAIAPPGQPPSDQSAGVGEGS